jgi:hypothetical protein
MANTSRPFGFRPSGFISGAPFNGQGMLHYAHASDSTDIYIQDVVKVDTTNRSSSATDGYAWGIPAVTAYTGTITTGVIRGIVAGVLPQPEFSQSATASLGLRYRTASTARYLWIITDPSVLFEVEEAGTMGIAGINKSTDLSYTAGNTTTGLSKSQVSSTVATTQKPFRVIRASQRVNNEPANANARWEVITTNSDLLPAAGGATGAYFGG